MLLLGVSELAAKAACRSAMSDTPAGAAMHTALLHPEGRRGFGGAVSLLVRAQPESWEALLAWARSTSHTHVGDEVARRNAAARSWRLARRLERELDRLANHPAYRGVAVLGDDTTLLPARRKAGDERWWPTVRMAMASPHGDVASVEVAELVPERVQLRGQVFTVWNARPSVVAPTEARSPRRRRAT